MIERSSQTGGTLERIDAVAGQFEEAWRAGRQPRIEDYLAHIEEPLRQKLFVELLQCEMRLLESEGRPASRQEYLERFAQFADVVQAVFTPTIPDKGAD